MATTTTAELACLDGVTTPAAEASIPVVDEGFIRGDGVFEVVRVYDGKPYKLVEHLDRLERSAANLRLGWDVPRAELEAETERILRERGGAQVDGPPRVGLTPRGPPPLAPGRGAPAPPEGAP